MQNIKPSDMIKLEARVPGYGGVAKAIPPMTSDLSDSTLMLNPENNPSPKGLSRYGFERRRLIG